MIIVWLNGYETEVIFCDECVDNMIIGAWIIDKTVTHASVCMLMMVNLFGGKLTLFFVLLFEDQH